MTRWHACTNGREIHADATRWLGLAFFLSRCVEGSAALADALLTSAAEKRTVELPFSAEFDAELETLADGHEIAVDDAGTLRVTWSGNAWRVCLVERHEDSEDAQP